MQNLILDFLFQKKFECSHSNALTHDMEGYCPDCGVYLKKFFYIVRCKHCEIKRDGEKRFDTITPKTRFCKNCGGSEFYIEKLDKISFIDIHYAIHTKEAIEDERAAQVFSQIWVENEKNYTPRKIIGLLSQRA